MPRGNGTGPMGLGPMTGRGAGFCAGYAMPGYATPGMGCGMGFGRGHGFRRMNCMTRFQGRARFGYPVNPAGSYDPVAGEKEVLTNQAAFLEKQLQQVRDQLKGFDEKA